MTENRISEKVARVLEPLNTSAVSNKTVRDLRDSFKPSAVQTPRPHFFPDVLKNKSFPEYQGLITKVSRAISDKQVKGNLRAQIQERLDNKTGFIRNNKKKALPSQLKAAQKEKEFLETLLQVVDHIPQLQQYEHANAAWGSDYAALTAEVKTPKLFMNWSMGARHIPDALQIARTSGPFQTAMIAETMADFKERDIVLLADQHLDFLKNVSRRISDPEHWAAVQASAKHSLSELKRLGHQLENLPEFPNYQQKILALQEQYQEFLVENNLEGQNIATDLNSEQLEANLLACLPALKPTWWQKLWNPELWSERTKRLVSIGLNVTQLTHSYTQRYVPTHTDLETTQKAVLRDLTLNPFPPSRDGLKNPISLPLLSSPMSGEGLEVRFPTVPPKVFCEETSLLANLRVYQNQPLPKDTHILLHTEVFDGIGDLEHTIKAAHHLLKMQKHEPLKFSILLERGSGVQDQIWNEKVTTLRKLGVDVYCIGDTGTDKQIIESLSKENNPNLAPIGISVPAASSLIKLGFNNPNRHPSDVAELVHEYANPGDQEILQTGFNRKTAGIWMSDDPVFDKTPLPLSDKAQQQLFGTEKIERSEWSVGYASLRKKEAKLNWMDLRLHTVQHDKNCSLVVSSSRYIDSNYEQDIHDLAIRHQFTDCVIVQRDGSETKLSLSVPEQEHLQKRTLRIVQSFIDEADLAAVIQQGADGSIGGSGDASFARSLIGQYPPFLETRVEGQMSTVRTQIESARDYFENAQYPLIAKWFEDQLTSALAAPLKGLTPSPNPYTKDLVAEWKRFQQQDLPRLDMGPWFELYVRRCVYVQKARNLGIADTFLAAELKQDDNSEAKQVAYEKEMRQILERLA
ncbi:MAG: hypothetical protein WCK49_07395 [Myxococcaceae bacterium]